MSSTYDIKTDLKEVEAMADSLSEYVRGDDLYGRINRGMFSQMPRLTAGALVMRLRRLDILRENLKDHQSKRLDATVDTYESVRREWTHHYETKLLQEAHSRIDSILVFFQECDENINKCVELYRPELARRTIVQEILKQMEVFQLEDADVMKKVKAVDNRLQHFLQADDFQWHDDLKPAYPKDEFWWLYQTPQIKPD